MRLNSLRLFAVRQLTCVIVFATALCMPALARLVRCQVLEQLLSWDWQEWWADVVDEPD